jgi:hypothetical protein
MARNTARPAPTAELFLTPRMTACAACGHALRADYTQRRTVTTLQDVLRLRLQIRRCQDKSCRLFHHPIRPEEEGRIALLGQEFGLDVTAFVGTHRYTQHKSVPEIHALLKARGVVICERSTTNLLNRYDELLALSLADDRRLKRVTAAQGRVVLAIDGLQPDVGHEVLWVVRDLLSGEVLRAKSLLSASQTDLAALLREVKAALSVPVVGVVSDGERAIRKGVAAALPDTPHQLCHFHYLREAAKPIYEADRHAKKELKKRVRGVRKIEREVEARTDEAAQIVRGYCAAVRSALTDDRRPPLGASGLRLEERLRAIATSLGRVAKKGGAYPS